MNDKKISDGSSNSWRPLSTITNLDSKVHEANMGPTWVLSAPDGPHVGPINLAIREAQWRHTLKAESHHNANFSSVVVQEIVVVTTTNAANGEKVGIMIIIGFRNG